MILYNTANRLALHACCMAINNAGLLILGQASTGKSELCLNLLKRGHRLVADDITELQQKNSKLIAAAAEKTFGQINLRKLGIKQITDLGFAAAKPKQDLHLAIYLYKMDSQQQTTSKHLQPLQLGNYSIDCYHLRGYNQLQLANICETIISNHRKKNAN